LIDSGSGPNIIKKRFTLGLGQVDILGPVMFHLVEDEFPIPQDAIIGSDFFHQFKANVNYKTNHLEWDDIRIPFEPKEIITIPARAN
ncbi:hypothetical protein ALC57_18633, partial [Trachymyrmex cornetzi]